MQSEVDYHEYCSGGFDPDDIVISGVAGRFPNCDTVGELKEALLTKKDLMLFSDERFEKGARGMPHSSVGLVKNLDKFDAQFFHLTNSTADYVEPQQRKVLEVTYEAIFDSGYDATSLRGANIGVYNATTCDDAKEIMINQGELKKNICISIGRYMNANRISFAFDFHGPSFSMDAACASSALALWNAFHDIRNGRIDAAVVSGCQLCLSPTMAIGYMKSGMCSENGKCIPFDAKAEGIVRCESISALFLQKASVARRVYATVSYVSTRTTGAVAEGISVPSYKEEVELFEDCLKGAGITAQDVDFVEAHGTGTVVGDPIELNAISSVYCEGRETPLLIGTIKGNVGHTEASSGICGILKGIISFETGLIPPNYEYNTPNPHCPALVDGRMVVVTEPVPLTKPYIPVNCFGFGGSIVQTMLKQNPIESTSRPEKRVLPSPAYVKPFRGYALYENEKEPIIQVKNALSEKRQVWFVLTGMGCQWPGMGLQLMGISAFAESMKKSAAVLKPYGVDLFEFLRPDKNDLLVERSITPAFVSIVAIQIALIDVLKSLDIHPDGIVGHSTGELVCAYADGCCTAKQTILSAYWRGIAVERSSLPTGAMAAVGLTWDKAVNKCPENVYPACDNASDSVTISGLKEPVEKFVEQLKSENIFARVVDAYGYAFHCKLVCPAKTILYAALEKLIPDPKPRTERWISSSFSEEEWDLPECKMAGPEYFIHNLTSSVRFKDALSKIPSDAITIEIGPHFLLQAILKRAIGSNAAYIGLMKRKEENNLNFLLESLGKLYLEGLDPKIERLYPPVKFPVPRCTPMLSDLIKWNHSHSFSVPKWAPSSTTFIHGFDLQNADSYLMDHKLDGRSLFPATGYIYLAWKALAEKHKKSIDEIPVVIENFKIRRATVLNPSKIMKFEINLLDISGNFEIMEGQSLVAFGKVYVPPNPEIIDVSPDLGETSRLPGEQVYNELKLRGYEYGPEFRGVMEMNIDGTGGLASWNEKWIPFLDSLLLFSGVLTQNEAFCLPTAILSFKINPNFFQRKNRVSVTYDANMRRCRCAGIEITELSADMATRRLNIIDPILEQYRFIPYVNVYTPPEEHRKQILQYKNSCNAVIDKLGEILKKRIYNFFLFSSITSSILLSTRCVFIEQPAKGPQLPPFSLDEPFYDHIVKKNLLMNVWKNGLWGSFRHLRIHGGKPLEPVEHSFAMCAKTGDLSSFEWRESHIKYTKLRPDQTFHVYYSALNFRDIMIASGKLSAEFGKDPEGRDDVVVGIECSGKDSDGRRLTGIVRNRGIGTANKVESLISLEVPDNWTLEEAATIPVVYMTCYYALITRARLQPGESILIHSGTGGIGFAAICIALSMQCEIFTTVGTEEKKEYLKKTFPQIKEENIGCSRDLSFEVMVKTRTAGKGVDVVLNSLADDKFLASIRCVAEHGRFVELGKYDLSLDREIGLKRFLDNITFHGVFIDRFLYNLQNTKFFIELNRLMQEGMKNGVVRPLDRTVFEREEVEKAFRYMAGGTHIGKVLIKIRDEEKERFVKPKILKLPAISYTQFYDTKVYIIIGGLGGFGIELTKWMIKKGAQKIILTSRYGARTPYHFLCLKRWKEKGCLVQVSQLNVAKKDEAKKLLELASQIGPVGGIFNSAVVLKDAFMEYQTAPDFQDVSAPKAEATKNLDELSRKFCPDLDYFVCFSSISCGRGNAGQTNYGYANSAMERVCEKRSSMGYHGLAIQWGIIGEVGVVHRHMGDDARIAGVCAQSVKSCLDTLDTFCKLKYPVVSSYVTTGSSQIKAQGDVLSQIAKMLGMKDLSELNNFRSFGEMGIDSLIGIEIKNLLESACDVTLTMQEIREMKFDDVKLLLENAEKAKESSGNKSTTLVTTAQVNLPAFTVHTEPVIPLNHAGTGKPVFIVTVGNGDLEQIHALGKSINNPAFALVWTKDIPSADMEALCTWYLNKITEVRNEPLHLVGFSTGGSIAFEMALQSEKAGVDVTNLTLLDGSSDLRNNLSNEDQKGISEVDILCKFVEQISPAGILKLREDLENAEHFDQRVKIVCSHLTTISTHPVNASDLADVIEAHVAKTKLNQSYVPQQKLKQDLHLIEDSNRILSNDIKEVKAVFSEVCSGKIFIYRTYGCDDLSNEENIPKFVNVFDAILKCE
ncbi:fatty acid synthase-like [Stegodyphus dumicola]|uniref:fatty acid synthase-like n=1 Tax=Stegodyphus dumicola TaxID=202533 RepID=UPI0015B1B624|nr:fatty acid synthase-like [Stegodyphus dumicola]